ncbi:hypothetical protein Ddye_022608 [Dipteronia dyeriana]|uniref:Protein FAR1-RELATED SEQUENCE n=1 Tax=Dipteronia dyeriana TaxID=168575 RepID=A0AAD9WSJ4_9ROSI|nr:hypothetical protein Ddye_022608 [Dipteronia dyeriana]
MLNFMTIEEFDCKWLNMVEQFGLNNNAWVNAMYSKRKHWAETFLRDSFFGGLRSTQRCESAKDLFDIDHNSGDATPTPIMETARFVSPSTDPLYSFTFPINDGGLGYMDFHHTNLGFNPSSSAFDLHRILWWGSTRH